MAAVLECGKKILLTDKRNRGVVCSIEVRTEEDGHRRACINAELVGMSK